jgi:hypothetical protein
MHMLAHNTRARDAPCYFKRGSVPPPAVHPRAVTLFPRVFYAKRLDLKSLKGQTKAEEMETQGP